MSLPIEFWRDIECSGVRSLIDIKSQRGVFSIDMCRLQDVVRT